jgi:hypothetical protein
MSYNNKINWWYLSENHNAIELIEKNQDKINWYWLSANSNAIELLKNNQDKIDWNLLSFNPNIFTYDYEKIKSNFQVIGEEIIAKALHPTRIFKLMEIYNKDDNTYFNY